MTDTNATPSVPQPALHTEDLRTTAIVVYVLYLAAAISCGIAGIAGVIVAYVKRGEAMGTIWESHYDNQISAFWVWLVLAIAGGLTIWVLGLGLVVIGIAFVWFLYRTIKGLLRAIEFKPYV
jgi:uncharacterized membrane protein